MAGLADSTDYVVAETTGWQVGSGFSLRPIWDMEF